ncbi:MAG TPA: DUF4388 domain-containing protein [Candidatus Limnocylindria bacterium]|nr:DUF4388 domain-containing protein [Candidatus Limnocylindria bacterium]
MTLRGSTSDFPLESVIGLLAGTSKTGELQVRGAGKIGALGFAGGRLVAAVMDGEGGENALGAIFAISEADFEFTPWESPPEANLEGGDLVALLKRAAESRDRIAGIRASIPDDHVRFRLSEKAADHGAVTFTPDRWRALLAVNGERDVAAIAEQLRLGKMQTLTLLAGLVKEGVIETTPPPGAAQPAQPPAARLAAEPTYEAPAREPWRAEAPLTQPSEPEPAAPPAWPADAGSTWGARPTTPEVAPETPSPPRADWSDARSEAAPAEAPRSEAAETRADLDAELDERLGGFAPPTRESPYEPRKGAEVPPAVDDRLATFSGLFAPGPAANVPAQPAPSVPQSPPSPTADVWTTPAPPAKSADSWMTPPPTASEAPANTWAPTAPPAKGPASDPWGAPAAAPKAQASAGAEAPSRADEWAPPPPPRPVPEAPLEKKKGGLFGLFRREETPAQVTRIETAEVGTKAGLMASLSNALLMEYSSYGKSKIETRMPNLLMRVDEQADPIDRPLPVVDDLIDAAALEREGFAEDQVLPYLATLVRQIYEEAEKAFGKDKAKKGYKAAQQQVFGGDANALQSPELAGKLPKV